MTVESDKPGCLAGLRVLGPPPATATGRAHREVLAEVAEPVIQLDPTTSNGIENEQSCAADGSYQPVAYSRGRRQVG
jgi:hypothetical protein